MLIIPAIDMIDGKCVRLTKGDYNTRKTYADDPVEVAKLFENNGLTRLHVVDLEGAKGNSIINLRTLERICSQTSLVVDFGGGIKSKESLLSAFNAGAAFVTVGSLAAKNPDIILDMIDEFASRLILGSDCIDHRIATSGWLEESDIDVVDFIGFYYEKGIGTTISTDIKRDGMLAGPSIELYREIRERVPGMNIIASGGVSSLEDLKQLEALNLYGAIVGKAYYEGRISLKELSEVNNAS